MKVRVRPPRLLKVKSIRKARRLRRQGHTVQHETLDLDHLSIDPVELERSICRDSLFDFVQRFWDVVCQEKPIWNWHIEQMCLVLQEAAERVLRNEPKQHDIVINIPPGTTKSLVASVMFPAWLWTRQASCKVISASHEKTLAMSMSLKSRDIVQSDKWKRLFGDIELREDQNAKSNFQNKAGGWRFAVGTDGAVVGRHAQFIIIDDPIDPQSAISEASLASANRFITQTLTTRKTDKDVTLTILIMQRLHQNDPSHVLLEESKKEDGTPVKHVCLPGVIEGPPIKFVRPRKLAKFYTKGPDGHHYLDPVRLSAKVLATLKRRLGQYGFAGQILQQPVPPGGGMFKTERILIDSPPPLRQFKQLVRFWDKAGTEGDGAHTAGVLMGEDQKGQFWILDVVRGQWDSGRREEIILQTAHTDVPAGDKKLLRLLVIGVEQEPGSGGKESAQGTAKRLAGYRVRIERPSGDKIARADPFSVQVNCGNVRIRGAEWTKDYLDEMKHFPISIYKDQVDATSGGFSLLTKAMIQVGALLRRNSR